MNMTKGAETVRLLTCDDLLLFSRFYHSKLNVFGQFEQFNEIISGFRKLWSVFPLISISLWVNQIIVKNHKLMNR